MPVIPVPPDVSARPHDPDGPSELSVRTRVVGAQLHDALAEAARLAGARGAALLLLGGPDHLARVAVRSAGLPAPAVAAPPCAGPDAVVSVANLGTDPAGAALARTLGLGTGDALLAVPVRATDRVVGALALVAAAPRPWSRADVRRAEGCAGLVGVLLHTGSAGLRRTAARADDPARREAGR